MCVFLFLGVLLFTIKKVSVEKVVLFVSSCKNNNEFTLLFFTKHPGLSLDLLGTFRKKKTIKSTTVNVE